jgi:lactate dehydrogenase-like 2-hydroxyacid dehydrogenase
MEDLTLVAATRRLPEPCEARLQRTYRLRFGDDASAYTSENLARHADGATALIVSPAEVLNAAAIAALPAGVKMLPTFSVGTDHIDLTAAKARGLVVTNTPGVLTDATADIAMLLILAVTRRGGEGERLVRSGAWNGWRPTQLMGASLSERTLGIIGMGRIGLAVAARARGFGLRILYHNRKPSPQADALHAHYYAKIDDMLPLTNILSLHCPMSPETRNLMDARRLALLPKGAFIINTARGGHVVDDALIAALRSGHIAGAGLDVYAGEPQLDRRYAELDNVVLLPHLGSATLETRLAMGMMVIDNIDAVLNGRPPLNPV